MDGKQRATNKLASQQPSKVVLIEKPKECHYMHSLIVIPILLHFSCFFNCRGFVIDFFFVVPRKRKKTCALTFGVLENNDFCQKSCKEKANIASNSKDSRRKRFAILSEMYICCDKCDG